MEKFEIRVGDTIRTKYGVDVVEWIEYCDPGENYGLSVNSVWNCESAVLDLKKGKYVYTDQVFEVIAQ